MKLMSRVYLVGSGNIGLSHQTDPHVYLIDGVDKLALIDSGSGVKPEIILKNIEKEGFNPKNIDLIINTHTHWDHARGNAFMKKYTGAQLVTHELGVKIVEDILWKDGYLAKNGIGSDPAKVDWTVADGSEIQVGELAFTVCHTPGHSEDSICLRTVIDRRQVLFTGDTVFAEGITGTVTAETNFKQYRDSVLKLTKIRADVMFPGHKLFILSDAFEHIDILYEKLAGRWRDIVLGPTSFFPGWWLQHRSSLYGDC